MKNSHKPSKIWALAAGGVCGVVGLVLLIPVYMTEFYVARPINQAVFRFSRAAKRASASTDQTSDPNELRILTLRADILQGMADDISKGGELGENYKAFMYKQFAWSDASEDFVQNHQDRLQCAAAVIESADFKIGFKVVDGFLTPQVPPPCMPIAVRVRAGIDRSYQLDKNKL